MLASQVQISRTSNGVRVASEAIPGAMTAALGLWVRAGSRFEAAHEEGAAHLFEHMAFKGTAGRDACAIAKALDRLGGASGAFTGREATCFYARTAAAGLETAFEVLADMLTAPRMDPAELELEKRVVLQEIAMVSETPEERLYEEFWSSVWRNRDLAHPILGLPESVASCAVPDLDRWRARHYAPGRILVAACGAVDHDELVAWCEQAFAGLTTPAEPAHSPADAVYAPLRRTIPFACEQSHILLGFPVQGSADPHRYVNACLNALLGGQMSSRLFQEVRERRGLAYAVHSEMQTVHEAGLLQVYAATSPERAEETLDVVRFELERLARGEIESEELEDAREHLLGLLYLGADSNEDHMMRLARNLLLFDRQVEFAESAERLRSVSLEQVREAAARVLDPERMSLCVLGPDEAEMPEDEAA